MCMAAPSFAGIDLFPSKRACHPRRQILLPAPSASRLSGAVGSSINCFGRRNSKRMGQNWRCSLFEKRAIAGECPIDACRSYFAVGQAKRCQLHLFWLGCLHHSAPALCQSSQNPFCLINAGSHTCSGPSAMSGYAHAHLRRKQITGLSKLPFVTASAHHALPVPRKGPYCSNQVCTAHPPSQPAPRSGPRSAHIALPRHLRPQRFNQFQMREFNRYGTIQA